MIEDLPDREDDAAKVRSLSEEDWRVYVERRLNRQDRVLGEIRNILLVGKAGWRFIQLMGGFAVAAWTAFMAWKGLK